MKKQQTTNKLKLNKQAIATLQQPAGAIGAEGKTVILITGTRACYPGTWVPESQGQVKDCVIVV